MHDATGDPKDGRPAPRWAWPQPRVRAPAGYFECYAVETAARIREQVSQALCACAGEQPPTVKDGRCIRCFGRQGDEA